jgi:hypothetical protein
MKDEPKPSRASVLHAVIDDILARRDGQIPTNIDGLDTFFDGVGDLANALLLRWHTRLVASLERGLVDDPEDREEAVIEAWRHANWIYWGVRMVIDELQRNPPTEEVAHAVRRTARNDWAVMAIAAGLASGFDEPAARVGHRLELEARRRNHVEHSTARDPQPRTLLGKFKETLKG